VERFSLATADRVLLDWEQWPNVDELAIEGEGKQEQFACRSRAIKLLLEGVPRNQILSQTGVSGRMAVHWLKRCLSLHPDGRICGFRALIPMVRLAPYRRRAAVCFPDGRSRVGAAGAFGQLLLTYQELERLIREQVLKLSKRRHIYESRIPLKSLHKHFVDRCRELNLGVGMQYPFNTDQLAYVSLSKYVRKLIKENAAQATPARFGSDAAKKLKTGDGSARPITRPFERVECDAHHIDAIFCILIPSIFGELIPKVVHRLWLIVIKDVVSRAILGYHLSLREECNADDILEAARNALGKWEPRELLIPAMKYAKGAGFPGNQNARFLGACWNEFSVDGGMANLSGSVLTKMKRVVDANPIVLPRHLPDDRPFVERFFGALEEGGFHRLPNTTGSSPKDSRRKNPELAAVKYSIQLEHLEDLVDVLIANFNSTPHAGIGYRTPLEYLEHLCVKNDTWPRQADPSEVERILSFRKTVKVQGSMDIGRRPYISLYGVKYSSDVLKGSYQLLGKSISVEVSRRDLRTVRAYAENGAELGILRAAPPWHLTPHTLEMRRAINSLKNRRMLDYVDRSDPVMELLEYLEQMARRGKTVPPLYLEIRRLFTEHHEGFRAEAARELLPTTQVSHLDTQKTEKVLQMPPRRKAING